MNEPHFLPIEGAEQRELGGVEGRGWGKDAVETLVNALIRQRRTLTRIGKL